MNLAVDITSWIWLALEAGLRVRDRVAPRGSTGRDGATALGETLGRRYEVYQAHTKRLVPGRW